MKLEAAKHLSAEWSKSGKDWLTFDYYRFISIL